MGLPVEETMLQAVALGMAAGTAVGLVGRMMLGRFLDRFTRW